MRLSILCFLMILGGGLSAPFLKAQEQALLPAPAALKEDIAQTIAGLKKEAEAGDPRAAYQLWMRYEFEGNIPASREWSGRYLVLLVHKAENADLVSMVELAKLYMQGTDAIPVNLEAARNWFYLAAQVGDPDSMYQFAHMAKEGTGGVADAALASQWFSKAYLAMEAQGAKTPNAHTAYWLGAMTHKGLGTKQDASKALKFYEESAGLGNPRAQILAAIMYRDGVGCEKDGAAALAWFKKAAEHGDCGAIVEVAYAYLEGKDAYPQDTKQALAWFEKAANLRDPYALRELSHLYTEGTLVPKDEGKALAYYQAATALGDGVSAIQLSQLLKKLNRSDEAFAPLRRAAQDMDSAAAAYELALLYADKKDRKEADTWMRRAAEAGYPLALVPFAYLQMDPTSQVDWNPLRAYQWFKIARDREQATAQMPLFLMTWVLIPLLVCIVLTGIYFLNRRIKKMMAAQDAEAAAQKEEPKKKA